MAFKCSAAQAISQAPSEKTVHQVVRVAQSFEPLDMGGHKRLLSVYIVRPVKLGRIEPAAPARQVVHVLFRIEGEVIDPPIRSVDAHVMVGIQPIMQSAVDDAPGDGPRVRIAGIVDSVLGAARIEDGREPPAARLGFRKPLRPPPTGTMAWYSLIRRVNIGTVFLASLGVLWFVGHIALGDPPGPRRGVELVQAVLLVAQVLRFFGAFGFFGWVLWCLHARYFPRAFSALGQGPGGTEATKT